MDTDASLWARELVHHLNELVELRRDMGEVDKAVLGAKSSVREGAKWQQDQTVLVNTMEFQEELIDLRTRIRLHEEMVAALHLYIRSAVPFLPELVPPRVT